MTDQPQGPPPWQQTPETPPAPPPWQQPPAYPSFAQVHGQQVWSPVQPPQPPPRRPWVARHKVLTGVGVVAVLAIVGAAMEPSSDTGSGATKTPVAAVTPREPAPEPTRTTAAGPAATTTTTAPTTVAPTPKPAPPKPVSYATLTARQWKLVVKNPDAYAGKHFVVHGVVTQFDAATGTDAFRASADGVVHRPSYGFADYEDNVLLRGDAADLTDLVQDDLFTAKITVVGSLSYDTQIGGETTVPELEVDSITVTGSVS